MELLLRLAGLGLLICSAITSADGNGPAVIKVVVIERSDVILPCSLSTNIESMVFNWTKDGQKEVFRYDAGITGQDEQFKGRVSHFQDELKSGGASIIIRKTKAADSGDYTCDFPRLQPVRRAHIQLVVDRIIKPDRFLNPGSPAESSAGLVVAGVLAALLPVGVVLAVV